MYVLIKADTTDPHLNCELLGAYSDFIEATGALLYAWDDALEQCISDGFIERNETEYACYVVKDYAQVAPPHGTEAIRFYIFDTDKEN